MTQIGERAFYDCTGLINAVIGNSVESIGHGTFRNCSNLTSITIPDKVTQIGFWTFLGCTGLISIHSKNPTPPTATEFSFDSIFDATLYVPKTSLYKYKSAEGWEYFKKIVEE